MNYLDTGTRDASQTLTQWFLNVLTEDVSALRVQTGYFRFGATKALIPLLARLETKDIKTHIVIGSNDSDTLHSDVSRLFAKLKMPRDNAKLAIVQFTNALFHPKVYHITRMDGSQAAIVGSANFTEAAITGGNVEAAVSLDTRSGDSAEVLTRIAQAVDNWLIDDEHDAVHSVMNQEDIDALLEVGVLTKQRPIREPRGQTAKQGTGQSGARRPKLIVLPPWPDSDPEEASEGGGELELDEPPQEAPAAAAIAAKSISARPPEFGVDEAEDEFLLSVETRPGFPEYVLFEPEAVVATSAWRALSGKKLKAPYVGLIMRLTKDSARHFSGGTGTANISIPVAVAKTFRFGIYPRSGRPRAEVSLRLRYHASTLRVEQSCSTNVMAYGVLKEDTGHGDLRMVLPAVVRKVAEEVAANQLPIPKSGDIFLLEWPSEDFDHFRITFMEIGCAEHALAEQAYRKAEQNHQLMGGSSCGLEAGISPEW